MFVDPMGAQIEREERVTYAVMYNQPYNLLRNGGAFRERTESVTHLQLVGNKHTRRVEGGRRFTTITRTQAEMTIFDYINGFQNSRCRHLGLG